MKIVLCEKPSAAKDIVAGLSKMLGKKANRNGSESIDVGEYRVIWAFGHLVELDISKTFGDWGNYPYLPKDWSYRAPTGKGAGDKQQHLRKLEKQIKQASEVIIATDCGREGELIARLILNRVKGLSVPMKRFWTSEALDTQIVINAFKSLADAKQYSSLYEEALARQHADAVVGINLSRALKDISKASGSTSLGRVQSPTLAVLVARELEIKNFKPEKFWTLHADFGTENGTYTGKWKRSSGPAGTKYRLGKDEADSLEKRLKAAKTGTIVQISKRKKVEKPPLLHSITTMQIAMNKKHGFSSKETSEALQSLYEKYKVCSYPRTESKYLGESNTELVKSSLRALGRTDLLSKVSASNKRVFDNTKLTDHHALIPTKAVNTSKFSKVEKAVYEELSNSLVAVFSPDAISEVFTITTEIDREPFESKGTCDLQPGWKAVFKIPTKTFEFDLEKGTTVPVRKLRNLEEMTKPPGRYTEATLLEVMENAHLLIPKEMQDARSIMKTKENAGLGTGATRSGIINGLLSPAKHYAVSQGKGKTKYIVPTEKGMQLIQSLPKDSKIANALLTADFENQLKAIRENQCSREQFLATVFDFVQTEVRQFKTSNFEGFRKNCSASSKTSSQKQLKSKCPECGKQLIGFSSGIKCESCSTVVWKKFLGKTLTENQLQSVVSGKPVFLKKLKSKAGKTFDAYVVYSKENQRLQCDFSKNPPVSKTSAKTSTKSSSSYRKTPTTSRTTRRL